MKDVEQQTIDLFANRSNRTIMWMAFWFGVGGGTLEMITNFFDAPGGFWAIWIPFCIITLPTIHYLCRRVRQLEKRLDGLTQAAEDSNAA